MVDKNMNDKTIMHNVVGLGIALVLIANLIPMFLINIEINYPLESIFMSIAPIMIVLIVIMYLYKQLSTDSKEKIDKLTDCIPIKELDEIIVNTGLFEDKSIESYIELLDSEFKKWDKKEIEVKKL